MFGLGTIINTAAIIAGGLAGRLFGHALKEKHRDMLNMACGISVLFIGIAGAMEGMLSVAETGESLTGGRSMLVVLSLALGGLLGEILGIEDAFTRFGEWLKEKTGNAKEKDFVKGFVTASLTVCIGAMAIVGAIRDGLLGDWSILATKGILDFIIIMVFTCSLGKGCMFSAIPVFLWQGLWTVLAKLIEPLMTDLAIAYISTVGSILIFCVGLNLVWGKKVRVANLIPALLFAVIAAFLPFSF